MNVSLFFTPIPNFLPFFSSFYPVFLSSPSCLFIYAYFWILEKLEFKVKQMQIRSSIHIDWLIVTRERSFVETNFVQTPRTNNVTQILPDRSSTPGQKGYIYFPFYPILSVLKIEKKSIRGTVMTNLILQGWWGKQIIFFPILYDIGTYLGE